MKNKTIIFLLVLIIFLNSCITKKNYIKNDLSNSVQVIKFMGTSRTNSYSIDENMFWTLNGEHVKLLINSNEFIDDIKSIKDTTSSKFEDYKYAFISRKGKETDTLYSDYTLKSWILKKNKKQTYYFDAKGETAENLRHMYSYFWECW